MTGEQLERFCGGCGSTEGWDADRPDFCLVCWARRKPLDLLADREASRHEVGEGVRVSCEEYERYVSSASHWKRAERAEAERDALRAELQNQWEYNHAEHCRWEWPHEGYCAWPLPEVLGTPHGKTTSPPRRDHGGRASDQSG